MTSRSSASPTGLTKKARKPKAVARSRSPRRFMPVMATRAPGELPRCSTASASSRPVHVRHGDVEQREMRFEGIDARQGIERPVRDGDVVPDVPEQFPHGVGGVGVVVYDQDAHEQARASAVPRFARACVPRLQGCEKSRAALGQEHCLPWGSVRMPSDPSRAPLAEDRAAGASALLVLDMFSTWDFPDAEARAPGAVAIAPRIAALQRRCARAGVPVVFVNDNQGRWRSDSAALLLRSAEGSTTGGQIAAVLTPGEQDYIVLKAKHSAFFATPLELLLRHLRVRHVILTGVAADQCIFLTAVEARMQDYAVAVPADCVAAQTSARARAALAQLKTAHRIGTGVSSGLRLPRA